MYRLRHRRRLYFIKLKLSKRQNVYRVCTVIQCLQKQHVYWKIRLQSLAYNWPERILILPTESHMYGEMRIS